ncbi:MAG: universal stress protein [Myxococcales bacterium]|nr:universal stress protein [Myxococcales bacterium]
MQIQHIVTCTDFSEAATRGVEAAFRLAGQFKARVTLLHVFHYPIAVDPALAPTTLAQAEKFLAEARDAAAAHLKELAAQTASKTGLRGQVECQVLEGPPYDAISKACKPEDLLVVSTHGRTGAKRLMLGSVAERLVRCAPCPVLTVPAFPASEG